MLTAYRAWVPALVLLAAALFTITLSDSPVGATSFDPTGDFTLADTAAGANSDLTIDVTFEEPDALFGGLITFIPPQFGVAGCPVGDPDNTNADCAGGSMPLGSLIGELDSQSVLGLLNGACQTALPLHFELMNATVDMSETVVFHDTDADQVGEMFEDDDEDGRPNGVEMWPEFLSRLVRDVPFPNGTPVEPIMRSYGQVNLTGSWVGLQFLFLEPGSMVNGTPLDASLGYPVVFVLQDTGDPGATRQPSAITDFCSPLDTSHTIFGLSKDNPATARVGTTGFPEEGQPVLTNPGDGGYNFVTFVASELDNDGDGIPNPLDPCPLEGNTLGWDPRVLDPPGDSDGDGLPDLCDPDSSAVDVDQDHDNDGFVNRGDNCPVVPNADQADIDRDSIGDACDDNPAAVSMHRHLECIIKEIDVGAGGDPAVVPAAVMPCALEVVLGISRGNVDCSEDGVTPIDSLHILRYDASIWPAPACIDGGDNDCDGEINVEDALQGLRFEAGLEVSQEPGCTPIGELIPS
jgi:hypothetical protein